MALDPKITDQGTKVKLTWTPDLSGQGYRFYVDGTAVSRTFKPEQSSTTFAKPDSGTHRYGVQKMDVVDAMEEASWPATPQPEPGGVLRDKPPGYPDYAGYQRVDLAGRDYYEMNDGADYLLTLGNHSYEEGIALVGGRKVVIIGGHITVTGSNRAAGVGLAMQPRVDASHYYIEGVRIKPTRTNGLWQRTITDGFALRGAKGRVTIQNCLVGPISVKTGYTSTDIHPDVFQVQAPANGVHIRVHRLTGYTEYTGVMESEFVIGSQNWSHVNMVATGYSTTDLDPGDIDPATRGHTAFGMYNTGITANMPNLTFTEFYWARDPQQSFQGYSPPELVSLKGAKYGKPSDGDFVTDTDVPWPYTSPGYQ